jgi:hypothetical protein
VTSSNRPGEIQTSDRLQTDHRPDLARTHAPLERSDEYLAYGYEHGVRTIAATPNCLGVQYFRKTKTTTAEFTVVSYWASTEDMQALHPEQVSEVASLATTT